MSFSRSDRLKGQQAFTVLSCIALLALVPANASAATLGSFTVNDLGTGTYGFFDHISFQVAVSSAPYPASLPFLSCTFPPGPSCPVLFTALFTPADAGNTFDFDGTNSSLSTAQILLANGINNALWGYFYLGSPASGQGAGYLYSEASTFFPSGGGPDFFGDQITGFRLQVNSASIMHDPLNGVPSSEIASSVTVFIEGTQVPEPSPWLLFAIAVPLLLMVRFQRFPARLTMTNDA